ncbi:hypothetical protein [Fimbriiglobus ruber]|uniref:Mobile element protein n=1 Tax=Fimbriiglobus ruber TaxID=1908690 RepID=A0A225DFJ0_9BACT|nr:hypothetical protein [Fimbriiglobus ruber]OWK38414.1 Mobile element protein [Fimbriiglobus ruber]
MLFVFSFPMMITNGRGKGLSIFAHTLGRVVYHLLRTKKVFDVDRFVRG